MSWYKQKTTWTGIGGIVTAVGGFLTGQMDLQTAIELFVGSLLAIFLRQGIAKATKAEG